MTRKVFVVPDIHGEYDKLLRLMDKILDKRTKDDLIIFLETILIVVNSPIELLTIYLI